MILINSKKKKVFFSIITVTKDSHLTLSKCINSVRKQTFKNFEHIIIDGGSNNKTIKIIKKNSKKIRYAISEKDKNLWEAINKGIKASNGKVICILNSDDIFFKNALKIAYSYFKSKKIGYLFGSVMKNKVYGNFYPEQIRYKFNIFPSHSISFFVKKSLHKKIGLYDDNFNFCADYGIDKYIYFLSSKEFNHYVCCYVACSWNNFFFFDTKRKNFLSIRFKLHFFYNTN